MGYQVFRFHGNIIPFVDWVSEVRVQDVVPQDRLTFTTRPTSVPVTIFTTVATERRLPTQHYISKQKNKDSLILSVSTLLYVQEITNYIIGTKKITRVKRKCKKKNLKL